MTARTVSPLRITERRCAVEGCDRAAHARGWCRLHYRRWKNWGDPIASPPPPRVRALTPLPQRIARRVLVDQADPVNSCWEWTGADVGNGYGVIGRGRVEDGLMLVHRAVWEAVVGPLTPGWEIDHLCRNRRCCNPRHLEEVTKQENILRGVDARNGDRWLCPCGHLYDPSNVARDNRGRRHCLACSRVKQRVREAMKRGTVPPIATSEADFMAQILQLALILKWRRAHFRPARTKHGWRTPVEGDGEGFPDLVLLRPPRLLFVETKSERGRLTGAQRHWLDLLGACEGVEVYVWRPADLDRIAEVLR